MVKTINIFYCRNCGAQSQKWLGKCSQCGEWNTFVEEIINKEKKNSSLPEDINKSSVPKYFSEINLDNQIRFTTNIHEFDRVLGGGIVPGTMILIGGEPGIGKSTLMLQVGLSLKEKKVLYISGEESENQIKIRAERLKSDNPNCLILTETSIQTIFKHIEKVKPSVLIIDSIQTLHTNHIESSAGSISQIRECTAELQKYAKLSGVPVFLIGHINKEGYIAGPKILEHMVDTVLQFEGDRHHIFRILRASKNRFGSTSELGIFEMRNTGLHEIVNPSEVLINNNDESLSGIAVSVTVDGMRPLLIESQALVSSAVYGTPQRSATGYDIRRLNMLLAVLEKRCGFRLGVKDVFLNITGGIKVDDPAIDLGIICAILSSDEDMPIPKNICFAGEIGLSGEIRPVNRIEQRISEAEKMGFEKIAISKYNKKNIELKNYSIEIITASKINEIFSLLFG